jgi:hypothetical protein
MTSTKMQKNYASFSDSHCFGAILHQEAMKLKRNSCSSKERQSFELSENLPEKSIIFFLQWENRNWNWVFFCKILRKITMFMKLSLKLWGHPWSWGAQKCLLMTCIVAYDRLESTFLIFAVRVKIQSWTIMSKMRNLPKFCYFCNLRVTLGLYISIVTGWNSIKFWHDFVLSVCNIFK